MDKVITKFRLNKLHDDWFYLEPWVVGQPEGKKDQWLDVISCLAKGIPCSYKRVGMSPLESGEIRWESPRNSNGTAVIMPKSQIKDFIKEALKVLNDIA